MKVIITEEQYNILLEVLTSKEEVLVRAINERLNEIISKGTRKIGKKSRNYGNLREEWCIGGFELINAYYDFDGDKFVRGTLHISKSLIEDIENNFSDDEPFVLWIIKNWYEKTMIPKFESIVGESGLRIKKVDIMRGDECIPEPIKPKGISDEEMINFINKNTLYNRQQIINKIESGERDLEDFYLDIVDTVERKKRLGF